MRRSKELLTSMSIVSAVALGTSACSKHATVVYSSEHSSSMSEHPSQSTILTPNLIGFLKPGTTDTCFNGGARPCAILLRTAPHLASNYINADPSQSQVVWPLEAYGNQAGDSLTIVCYDANGDTVRPYEGNSSSSDWYEVAVPEQEVLNPQLKADPAIKTIQQGGQTAIAGWGSIEWFGQSTPDPHVPVCTT